MTLHVTRLAEHLAFLGFLALFPGFVIYHLLVMGFDLPPALAGFFGPTSALLLVAYAPLVPKLLRSSNRSAQLLFLAVLCLLAFLMAWSIVHRALLPSPTITEAFAQSWRAILLMAALFLVGLYLPLDSTLFQRFMGVLLGVGGVLVVWYYVRTGAPMFYARDFFGAEFGASYQGFARSALVVSILALLSQRSFAPRAIVVVFSLIVVWFLGARSELVGLAVATLLYFGVIGLRSRSVQISGAVLVPVIALLAAFNLEVMEGSRHMQLLTLADASSWQARLAMNEVAVMQIRDSPVLGAFGGHISSFGSSGAYAHNALSAWVSYGLGGFFGYMTITLFATGHSLRRVMWKGDSALPWVSAAVFGMVVLVLVITTKSVFWPLPAFAWGLYGNALLSKTGREEAPETSPAAAFPTPVGAATQP